MIRKNRAIKAYEHKELGIVCIGDRLQISAAHMDTLEPGPYRVLDIRPIEFGDKFLHRTRPFALLAESDTTILRDENGDPFIRPILELIE